MSTKSKGVGDRITNTKAQTPSNKQESVVKGRYTEDIEQIKKFAEMSAGAAMGISVAMLGIAGIDMSNNDVFNKLKAKKGQIKLEDTPLKELKDLGIKLYKKQFNAFRNIETKLGDLFNIVKKDNKKNIEDIKDEVIKLNASLFDITDIFNEAKKAASQTENETGATLVRLEDRDIKALLKAINGPKDGNKDSKISNKIGIELVGAKDLDSLLKTLKDVKGAQAKEVIDKLNSLREVLITFDPKYKDKDGHQLPNSKDIKTSLDSIKTVVDFTSNIGTLDKKQSKESIKSLKYVSNTTVKVIKDMLQKFKDIHSDPNTSKAIGGICSILSETMNIGKISDDDRKRFGKNLEFFSCIFGMSQLYPSLGLKQFFMNGIIKDIIDGIQKVGVKAKETDSSVTTLQKFFEKLSKMSKSITEGDIKHTSKAITLAYNIYGKNGQLEFLIKTIRSMIGRKTVDDLIEKITAVSGILECLANVANENSLKKAIGLKLSMKLYIQTVVAIGALIEQINLNFEEKEIDKAVTAIGNLQFLFNEIKSDDMKLDSKNIIDSLVGVFNISMLSIIVSSLSDKANEAFEKIVTTVQGINAFVQETNRLNTKISDDIVPNIEDTISVICSIGKLSFISIIISVLSKPGISSLEALSDLYSAIRDFTNNLNSNIVKLNNEVKVSIGDTINIIIDLAKIAILSTIAMPFIPTGLLSLYLMQYEVKAINGLIEKLNELTKIKNAKSISQSIEIVKQMSILSIVAGIAMPFIPMALIALPLMRLEVKLIQGLLNTLDGIKVKSTLFKKVKSIYKVVLMCAGMMFTAGIIGTLVIAMLPQIMAFSVAIGAFILCTIGAINLATKGMRQAIKGVKEMCILITVSGFMMLLGAAFMDDPGRIVAAFAFAIILGGFIWLVTSAYAHNSKKFAKSMAGAIGLSILVIASGIILLVAGKIISDDPMVAVYALAFGLILGGFIWLVTKAYSSNMKRVGAGLVGAAAVAILIAVSGIILLTGGYILQQNPWMVLTLPLFAAILYGFIWGITKAYQKNMKGIAMSMIPAAGLAVLVIASGIILLAGAYIIQENPWMAATLVEFAVILGAFIFAITKIYQKNMKGIAKAWIPAAMMAALVIVVGGTLLYAGKLMADNPIMMATIPIFTACTLVMVGGMTAMLKILGKMSKSALIKGGIALAAIAGLIWLIGKCMEPIMELSIIVAAIGWEAVFLTLGAIGTTIGGIAVIVAILGGILAIPCMPLVMASGAAALAVIAGLIWLLGNAMQPVIMVAAMVKAIGWEALIEAMKMTGVVIGAVAATCLALGVFMIPPLSLIMAGGAVLLASITGIIYLLAGAIKEIAIAAMVVKAVGKIDEKMLAQPLEAMIKILPVISKFGNPLTMAKVWMAEGPIERLGRMMASIAMGVKSMADLKVAVYGDDGKIKTYRQLNESDFNLASKNVTAIVTCLGGAVMDAYDRNPDMFTAGTVGDLFGMDTPFDRVVKCCTGLGKMISGIAEGVKDMAELKVPVYDENGKKKGYRSLNNMDFINAAFNTGLIISVLGKAVMDLYEGKNMDNPALAQAMFHDDSWLGAVIGEGASRTPFGIVIAATTGLGKMISDIATGVKDMAELRVPIYNDKGEQTGSREMNIMDFTNAAMNTGLVISCLGNAIMTMYKDPELGFMFHDKSLIAKYFGGSASRTPFGIVMGSLQGIGELMSGAVKSIQDVLNMTIPEYDKNGRETGKKLKFDISKLKKGGEVYTIVQDMLSCIPGAIIATYKGNEAIFKDGGFMASFFGENAENTPFFITKICIDASIPLLDKARAAIEKVLNIKDFDSAKVEEAVNTIISCIPEAIIKNTWNADQTEVRKMYTDIKWLDKINDAFSHYSNILKNISSTVGDTINILSKNKDIDTNQVFTFINRILTDIPSYIQNTYTKNQKLFDNIELAEKLKDSFNIYKDIIDNVTSAYKKINKLYLDVFNNGNIEEISNNLSTVTEAMFRNVATVPHYITDNIIRVLTDSFVDAAKAYRSGVKYLAKAVEDTPDSINEINTTAYMIKHLSETIKDVQFAPAFTMETVDTSMFVKSINTLNVNKAKTMISLVTALDKMATKLGGLDKLTKELSDDLSVVLKHLTNELKASAKVIDKAEKIQKDRHKKIEESIKSISKLMADPLQVIVTQSTDNATQNNPDDTTKTEKSKENTKNDTKRDATQNTIGEYDTKNLTRVFKNGRGQSNTDTQTSTNTSVNDAADQKNKK